MLQGMPSIWINQLQKAAFQGNDLEVFLKERIGVFAHAGGENQATKAGKTQPNPTVTPIGFLAAALLLFFATNDHISSAQTFSVSTPCTFWLCPNCAFWLAERTILTMVL